MQHCTSMIKSKKIQFFDKTDFIPGVIMTTAQKSPISASDKRKWFILWANSNTESIRNFAFPGAMALMVSFRMMSPLRQTKLCNRLT